MILVRVFHAIYTIYKYSHLGYNIYEFDYN